MKIMLNFLAVSGFDSQAIYAHNIFLALSRTHNPDKKFVVFCDKDFACTLPEKDYPGVVVFYAKNKIIKILAMNLILPIYFWFGKYDYVYSPNVLFPVVLLKRSIVTINDLAYLFFKDEESRVSGIFIRIMYKLAVSSKRVVAISESVKKELLDVGFLEKNIVVAHNALPEPLQSFKLSSMSDFNIDIPYLVYVGMYRQRKNVETIIKALPMLSNIGLVLVGSVVAEKERLTELAESLGAGKKVFFVGLLDELSKRKLVKNSIALVVPSFYEGFGFPILEGQNMGKTVISADVPSLREVGGSSVLYFDPKSPESLVQAVKLTVSDSNMISNLCKAGLKNVKRFSWANTVSLIFNIS